SRSLFIADGAPDFVYIEEVHDCEQPGAQIGAGLCARPLVPPPADHADRRLRLRARRTVDAPPGMGHLLLFTINFSVVGALLLGSLPGIFVGSWLALRAPMRFCGSPCRPCWSSS